ncbi:unknown protein [Cronobacter turicensis z3032]|uniref:Uncharacterized protein n=1 Tax=Cronobacter turicensis (strain DSM 18703 / CCUG 55852 / LMG 23827 / z3032) TaxID=693216 RepID=C9Y4B0_CROTZ|nr:unknown protein [Cronobacter turicensis z3032]
MIFLYFLLCKGNVKIKFNCNYLFVEVIQYAAGRTYLRRK